MESVNSHKLMQQQRGGKKTHDNLQKIKTKLCFKATPTAE